MTGYVGIKINDYEILKKIKTENFARTTSNFRAKYLSPNCTGEVNDRAGAGGLTMSMMRAIFNNHTHPEKNQTGGSTEPPNEKML